MIEGAHALWPGLKGVLLCLNAMLALCTVPAQQLCCITGMSQHALASSFSKLAQYHVQDALTCAEHCRRARARSPVQGRDEAVCAGGDQQHDPGPHARHRAELPGREEGAQGSRDSACLLQRQPAPGGALRPMVSRGSSCRSSCSQ